MRRLSRRRDSIAVISLALVWLQFKRRRRTDARDWWRSARRGRLLLRSRADQGRHSPFRSASRRASGRETPSVGGASCVRRRGRRRAIGPSPSSRADASRASGASGGATTPRSSSSRNGSTDRAARSAVPREERRARRRAHRLHVELGEPGPARRERVEVGVWRSVQTLKPTSLKPRPSATMWTMWSFGPGTWAEPSGEVLAPIATAASASGSSVVRPSSRVSASPLRPRPGSSRAAP